MLRVEGSQFTCFTCFTSTKVQILQKFVPPQGNRAQILPSTKVQVLTPEAQILPSTKVQILTPEAPRRGSAVRAASCVAALCLMPYALCLMPYALCLMPDVLCRVVVCLVPDVLTREAYDAAPRLCRAAFPHFQPQALFRLRELGAVNFSSKYTVNEATREALINGNVGVTTANFTAI